MKNEFNKSDTELLALSSFFNTFALIMCWIAILLALIYYAATQKLGLTFVLLLVVPFRYFFFDINPDKLSKRPPSLDRIIPVTIYVSHLSQAFPIPNGNILATGWGFLLAVGRAFINGFGLLYFDSFTFFYKVRNDNNGIPLNQDIKALHSSDRLKGIEKQIKENMIKDPDKLRYAKDLTESVKQMEVANKLTEWDFEIKRYVNTPSMYFKNAEISNSLIDDKYSLDIDAYNKAHPNKPIILSSKAQKHFENLKKFSSTRK